jgi:hypothetical protein
MTKPIKPTTDKKEIFAEMKELGFFEYGAVIPRQKYLDFIGIIYPPQATRQEFEKLELEELSFVGYCRDQLLNSGKYLKQDGDSYRVLLPSENQKQVEHYMANADNKLKRAIKLAKNTPATLYADSHRDVVRATMKLQKAG